MRRFTALHNRQQLVFWDRPTTRRYLSFPLHLLLNHNIRNSTAFSYYLAFPPSHSKLGTFHISAHHGPQLNSATFSPPFSQDTSSFTSCRRLWRGSIQLHKPYITVTAVVAVHTTQHRIQFVCEFRHFIWTLGVWVRFDSRESATSPVFAIGTGGISC